MPRLREVVSGVELVLPAVSAIIAGLAVALVALSIAFTVLLSSWWMRDRKRRRDREAARKGTTGTRWRVAKPAASGISAAPITWAV